MFNGRREAEENLAHIVASLSDPGLLAEKSGFIFKSQILEDTFRFSILPSFLDGERTYHYTQYSFGLQEQQRIRQQFFQDKTKSLPGSGYLRYFCHILLEIKEFSAILSVRR